MRFYGYTVPPVVASFLLTSCTQQPPCLDLSLKDNQLAIATSSLESSCNETTYTRNSDGTIQSVTRKHDHKPSKTSISYLIISFDEGSPYQKIPGGSYSIQTKIQLPLRQGFHEISVVACTESNDCAERKIPVYSFGAEIILASVVANDQQPPEITSNFIVGKTILCRDCRATDLNGIVRLTLEQEGIIIAKDSLNYFKPVLDYSHLIKTIKIDPEKPLIVTAFDPKGNHNPLKVSFDGYASLAIGGP